MTTPSLPNIFDLKKQAHDYVVAAKNNGEILSHSAALEKVAKKYGFKNWNACVARAKDLRPATATTNPLAEEFDELRIPMFGYNIGETEEEQELNNSTAALFRWAKRLEFVANSIPEESYVDALRLMDHRFPYLFEQNLGRWPDRLFHLVDRSYEPFSGIAFSANDLQEIGVVSWSDRNKIKLRSELVAVMDDHFWLYPNRVDIKRLARLLVTIASKAKECPEVRLSP